MFAVLQRIAVAGGARPTAGSASRREDERAQRPQDVTRAGSGFVLSMRVYQGISRKNAK